MDLKYVGMSSGMFYDAPSSTSHHTTMEDLKKLRMIYNCRWRRYAGHFQMHQAFKNENMEML